MSEQSPPLPTDAELALLRALWEDGPATVRELQERLRREAGYTTVLKLLQIMREKGLVTRDESSRAHVYAAALGERPAQRRLIDDLMERAFGGSARTLVMRALSSEEVSAEELAEIRALIDDLESRPAESGKQTESKHQQEDTDHD